MSNPIPDYDLNLVLPPHLGDPVDLSQLSPYECTSVDLCQRFSHTPERRQILSRFLDFRDRLRREGLTNGFQWIDGSFLENVELRDKRAPRDIDVVTVFWGYDPVFLQGVGARFPEVADPTLAKANFSIDHYPFDAGFRPDLTLEWTRYWILLFSHSRLGIWKGMLKVSIDTPAEDAAARQELAKAAP